MESLPPAETAQPHTAWLCCPVRVPIPRFPGTPMKPQGAQQVWQGAFSWWAHLSFPKVGAWGTGLGNQLV